MSSFFTWKQEGRGLGFSPLATSCCEGELHVLHTPGVLRYWVLWTRRTLNYSVKVDKHLAYVRHRVKINSQQKFYCDHESSGDRAMYLRVFMATVYICFIWQSQNLLQRRKHLQQKMMS